jgi:hypothetical protein
VAKQTANNGPSQASSTKSVTFSRQAAQRIAKAVRTVEGGNRNQPGIRFDHPIAGATKTFRMAKFTGTWTKDAQKTVTFLNQTATPNTVSAYNVFATVSATTATSVFINCAIAKDGTAWYVIAAECS